MNFREWLFRPTIETLNLSIAAAENRTRLAIGVASAKSSSDTEERFAAFNKRFDDLRDNLSDAYHAIQYMQQEIQERQHTIEVLLSNSREQYAAALFAVDKQLHDKHYQENSDPKNSLQEAVLWAQHWLNERRNS